MAAGDQVGDLAHDLLGGDDGLVGALERDDVAAQEDVAVDVLLDLAQHRVLGARQLAGDVVGKLDLAPHPGAAPCTAADTRRPSARPPTFGITSFITLPMSFGDEAPASAIASATMALQLLVGQLGREVAGDQLGLGLLAGDQVVAAGLAELLRGVEPALALAAQDAHLVVVALLRRLLQLGQHETQPADAISLTGAHRRSEILLHLVGQRHRFSV